jgi:predicted trehalose synthase
VTAEDMDREAGRTRREYREAKQELATLQSKARRIGQRMQEVGAILADEPHNLIFVHESHDPRFQSKLQIQRKLRITSIFCLRRIS